MDLSFMSSPNPWHGVSVYTVRIRMLTAIIKHYWIHGGKLKKYCYHLFIGLWRDHRNEFCQGTQCALEPEYGSTAQISPINLRYNIKLVTPKELI